MPEADHIRSEAEADAKAMQRLSTGEEKALSEIMQRWKARLVAYLYRFTGNKTVALDLAQETFVRLYQTRSRYRQGARFSTWLFGIAANLGRNHLRWAGRHPTLPLDAVEEEVEPTALGNPAQSAEERDRSQAVGKAVAALPADLREVLLLSEYERLPQVEIAAVAGCSVKAVERRLAHAREQLHKSLSPYFRGN